MKAAPHVMVQTGNFPSSQSQDDAPFAVFRASLAALLTAVAPNRFATSTQSSRSIMMISSSLIVGAGPFGIAALLTLIFCVTH